MRIAGSKRPGPGAHFNGNGSDLEADLFCNVIVKTKTRIIGWSILLLDDAGEAVEGSAVVDLRVVTLGAVPAGGDSICGSDEPEVTTSESASSSGAPFPSGNPVIPAGSCLQFYIESVSAGVQQLIIETEAA